MDLNYLKKLLKVFDESGSSELQIEEEGLKLKLSKRNKSQEYSIVMGQGAYPPPHGMFPPIYQPEINRAVAAEQAITVADKSPKPTEHHTVATDSDDGKHKIFSPIVGTFYRAPSPDSEPYVEVGSRVVPGQTLCIVEAMKLMNEIESDIAGTVEKILVANSQPVEYHQLLFVIKPD
jgi:acetyl-CoA carboxylase biotin carboxyl carrier protein